MPPKIKKIFLALLLAEIFFSYAPAFAQTTATPYDYSKAGVSTQIEQFLCSPGTGGGTVLYQCINQLYKFAIVLASVIGVFYLVIAGYIYMGSDGNTESVDKAKSMIESTIASLVILLAGYVLLNAINPDLIQFHSVQPPSVTNVVVGTVGITAGPVSGTSQQVAQLILQNPNINLFKIHSCNNPTDNATPYQNIVDTSNGQPAQRSSYKDKCAPNYTGPGGSTNLSNQMLIAIAAAGNAMPVSVNEIAGGVHSNTPTNSHYSGNAVDIAPQNPTAATQTQLVGILRTNKANQIGLECSGGPNNGYETLTGSNDGDASCIGKPGYHIHASFP